MAQYGAIEENFWHKHVLSIALMLTVFIEFLHNAMIGLAAGAIIKGTGSDVEQFTWSVTAYAIISVLVIANTGWFVQHWGYRRYLVASVVLFSSGALACALAQGPYSFIAGRCLAAVGGGALFSTSRVALQDLFDSFRRRAARLYFYGIFVALILGAPLSSYVLHLGGWRWIFLSILPLCATVALLLQRVVPNAGIKEEPGDFHLQGVVFLALGIGLLQLSVQRLQLGGWTQAHTLLALLLLSITGFALFYWHQARVRAPALVDFKVLNRRTFLSGLLLFFAYYFGSQSFAYVFPLYTAALGYDHALTGHSLLLSGIASLLFLAMYFEILLKRVDNKHAILLCGFILAASANLLLAHLSYSAGIRCITLILLLKSLAAVLLIAPIPALAFYELSGADFAHGYRLKNIVRQISISISTTGIIIYVHHRQTLYQRHSGATTAILGSARDGFQLIALCYLFFALVLLGYFIIQALKPKPGATADLTPLP